MKTTTSGLAILVATLGMLNGAAAQQTEPPAAAPLRPYRMPTRQTATLPNGVTIAVVQQRALPIITVRFISDGGAMYDPPEKSGLALITAEMLREGTSTMTGPELATQMEKLGASFAPSGSYSLAQIQLTALVPVFSQAFGLAAEVWMKPAFPAAELARVQRQGIAGFEQAMAQVEGIAPRVFQKAVFDPRSPFSRGASGDATTLAAITRDDVATWHRTNYVPGSTTLLFVGDIDMDAATRLAAQAMGAWTGTAPRVRQVITSPRTATGTRVILVDRPGSAQSAIKVGGVGIGGGDPDLIPMTALNHVLGGGFNSRANMNLRERNGYAYGAFAEFATLRGAGWLDVYASVRTDATAAAISEALMEYRRIVNEPIPAEELGAKVSNLVAGFPATVQSVQGLAQRFSTVILYGLPLDFYATYREKLAAVTPAQAQAAARAHLPVTTPTIVAVGDLAMIEQPIRSLNLGTVEVWDRDGNRLR